MLHRPATPSPVLRARLTRKPRPPAGLFNHDFDFAAGPKPLARFQPVEGAEALDLAIGNRHPGGELLDRIAGGDRHHLQPQRLRVLDLGELMRRKVPTDSRNTRSVSIVRCLAAKMKR